ATHDDAARVGLLTIVLMVLWKPLVPKRLKWLPAPLLAVAVAAGVTALFGLPIRTVPVPDRLLDAVTLPGTGGLGGPAARPPLRFAGLSSALIPSAEPLLSAPAVDKLHGGPRPGYDRELAAQGVGNLLCGFLGALPMSGVIVRSAANVEAGARSR